MAPTYTREEILHKINNTSDISELREIAWLVNEEENEYPPAVFSEIYYHVEGKLNEMANNYILALRSILKVMLKVNNG